jgi:tetratricopeptide (TPR) repeat protein
MKKLILLVVPLLLLGAIGGALWWTYGRAPDLYVKAQKMMDAGDLRGAQLELRNAVRVNPNNAAIHYRLGQVAQRMGDAVAAERDVRRSAGASNALFRGVMVTSCGRAIVGPEPYETGRIAVSNSSARHVPPRDLP